LCARHGRACGGFAVTIPAEPLSSIRGLNGLRISNALFERILPSENLIKALHRARRNRGSHGIDWMKVDELPACLKTAWPFIKEELLAGTYRKADSL